MKRNLGATNVLIHTVKGQQLFESARDSFIVEEANPDTQVLKMKEMTMCVSPNSNREQFLSDAQRMNGTELFKKYFPVKAKQQLLYYGRYLAVKTGAYSMIKSILR